jgi:hypothetical protein
MTVGRSRPKQAVSAGQRDNHLSADAAYASMASGSWSVVRDSATVEFDSLRPQDCCGMGMLAMVSGTATADDLARGDGAG